MKKRSEIRLRNKIPTYIRKLTNQCHLHYRRPFPMELGDRTQYYLLL